MGFRWAELAPAPLALGMMLAGGAEPAQAQRARELGLGVVATASDPALGAGMVYGALRTSRRLRISAAGGAGVSDGRAAWRGELLAHFLLSPQRRQGVGWYGAGGIAAVGGPVEQGYLVLTVGVEARAGGRGGCVVAGGGGGGAPWRRFAAGQSGP